MPPSGVGAGIGDIDRYAQRLCGLASRGGLESISAVSATSGMSAGGAIGVAAASPVGQANTAALGQSLNLFMQALYQAVSNAQAANAQGANAQGANAQGASEQGTGTASARNSQAPGQSTYLRSRGYQLSQGGLYGKVESLIGGLSAPSAANVDDVSGLQAAFNRLWRDLGSATPADSAASAPASLSAGNNFATASAQGSDLTLNTWLRGLQQSLQQPGSPPLSSLGNTIDLVA